MSIDSQVCFHRWLFADAVRPRWCITGPVGPLVRIGWVPDCCQWRSWSILWFVYILAPHWEHSATVCGLMAGMACLQLAHPPTPTTPPTPYKWHLWYYRGCKNYLKDQQWMLHGRVSYETLAISLLYVYSKSCAAIV